MKAFEEHWTEEGGDDCPECKVHAEEAWRAVLEWARVKVENYTPEDVCYFIDEELKQ